MTTVWRCAGEHAACLKALAALPLLLHPSPAHHHHDHHPSPHTHSTHPPTPTHTHPAHTPPSRFPVAGTCHVWWGVHTRARWSQLQLQAWPRPCTTWAATRCPWWVLCKGLHKDCAFWTGTVRIGRTRPAAAAGVTVSAWVAAHTRGRGQGSGFQCCARSSAWSMPPGSMRCSFFTSHCQPPRVLVADAEQMPALSPHGPGGTPAWSAPHNPIHRTPAAHAQNTCVRTEPCHPLLPRTQQGDTIGVGTPASVSRMFEVSGQ